MTSERKLEHFLTDNGFIVEWLSPEQTWALARDWQVVFGAAWEAECRMRTGYRAVHEYEQQSAGNFRIVPLSRHPGGPPEVSSHSHLKRGLECRGDAPLPNLSEFATLEFAVSPPDFAWTLVHTHEDHALGGPYFVRREWAETGRRNHGQR